MSVLNKERNDCECVEYQDSTMWEKLNRSDVDGCLWAMFLIHMVS